ncbi:MAG: glycosyltransferase [Rhodobacteraceae bacterium]|nr:glycosyltransferase [Paracoccaceae bacterium]
MLQSFGHDVGVIAPCAHSVKEVRITRRFKGPRYSNVNGVHTFRDDFIAVPKAKKWNSQRWVDKCRRLPAPSGTTAPSRPEVRNILWESDCLVSSSDAETFGVTLIEAMASGLPVVATRSGGPEGFIVPDVGFLVTPGNPEELSNAMKNVVDDQQAWNEKSDAIAEYAKMRFGKSAIHREYMTVYKCALG